MNVYRSITPNELDNYVRAGHFSPEERFNVLTYSFHNSPHVWTMYFREVEQHELTSFKSALTPFVRWHSQFVTTLREVQSWHQ